MEISFLFVMKILASLGCLVFGAMLLALVVLFPIGDQPTSKTQWIIFWILIIGVFIGVVDTFWVDIIHWVK